MLSPYYRYLGPAWLRRSLALVVPDPNFRRLKRLADVIDASSRKIFKAKKEAVLRGDDAVKEQVSGGKDIMSVLRMFAFCARLLAS